MVDSDAKIVGACTRTGLPNLESLDFGFAGLFSVPVCSNLGDQSAHYCPDCWGLGDSYLWNIYDESDD